MADELDRVRISAAELRAEGSNVVRIDDGHKATQEEHCGKRKHRNRECKRPDLQRYQPMAGHPPHQQDNQGELVTAAHTGDPLILDCESNTSPDPDPERCDPGDENRPRGDGSNSLTCQKDSGKGSKQLQAKPDGGRRTNCGGKNNQEPASAPNLSRKPRKPDRVFYQPGSRRNVQGKECGVSKEPDKPPPGREEAKAEPQSEASGDPATQPDKEQQTHRRKDKRDANKPPSPTKRLVEDLTSKVENLGLTEEGATEIVTQEDKELRRKKPTGEGRKGGGGGEDDGRGKTEKKRERGNRRRRGGEKDGEGSQDPTPAQAERRCNREPTGRREEDVKPGGGCEREKSRGKERGRRGSGNNKHLPAGEEMDVQADSTKGERGAERSRRDKPGPAPTVPSSKRYSKSDIRRSRNRTYSSSSASSAASLEGPGLGRGMERGQRGTRGRAEAGRGGKHLQSWTTNGESSTESMEGSEVEERSPRNPRGAGRPALQLSLDKQAGHTPPRGRGRGILVLPAHTQLSNSPEPGPRLLLGGRPGGRGRGRGGGGVRRLWDPNNPDQKPALNRSQPSQHAPLQQPMYLQTGPGYGQLHFLDTDDELVGSPPIHQGEPFPRQQQAAAMAYYKFQSSDNPYCYPVTTSGGPTHQRYPYPYHMGPYQVSHANGMYPGPAAGQVCLSYRGSAYPGQQGGGAGLTPEEAEQQARGELGRLLRAADSQELQLSNLLSRDRLSADGLERMSQLRADLLALYEQVILTDIEFSDSQNLDQALWKNVFYQVIERFRQLLKDPRASDTPSRIRSMLLTLLDEGAVFFDALLQKLQTVFQFKLEDYMDGMAIRARPLRKTVKYALISAQRCMICQGDIARYREQASDSANYGKARSWYLKAQQIAPKNGRPYNQLALLAVYTKRKLDAVYYYMRSLAASNPILTAKESLMSLFEEAKRKADQLQRRRREESEGGSRGPAVRGRGRGGGGGGGVEEDARVEIWVRPSGHTAAPAPHRGGSGSSRDSSQDGELCGLSASDLNKRFILSFLHAHGKLFTKVGMESFPDVATGVLQEFRVLLQHSPPPLGSTRMLQIITINMFTIHNTHSRADGGGEVRSVLQEQTTSLGLAMFSLLVQRCTELLTDTPAEPVPTEDGEQVGKGEGMVRVSAFPVDLRELLPSIKVWSDWMLGHPDEWNPPPRSIDGCPDVWQCLADLCNVLARVHHEEVPLYKADTEDVAGDEELSLLLLEEDRLLAGFVPLLAAPQEPCYVDRHTDLAIAADCKRVTVLKYFLEALCGQEEPLLAFKGGKYVSTATAPSTNHLMTRENRKDSQTEKEGGDVIVEAESSLSASEEEVDVEEDGEESDIRELKARRHALASELAQRQKRRAKIQAVLQTGGQLELEVCPLFLVPDTNGFIDHLDGLKKLLHCGTYVLVVPLIVITELDGLVKGQDNFATGSRGNSKYSEAGGGGGGGAHTRVVQERARLAVTFLEQGFSAREPCLRALTSRGSSLESIAFRSEDTSGQQGNNDDVILSCCLHYCRDKAKDFMPEQRDGPVRLRREVVLLTDDRNLRVKALTRNVPVRDIPSFISWAKVG